MCGVHGINGYAGMDIWKAGTAFLLLRQLPPLRTIQYPVVEVEAEVTPFESGYTPNVKAEGMAGGTCIIGGLTYCRSTAEKPR